MMCFSPISLKNPAAKKSNNRLIVPCGKCYSCKMNNRISWTFRITKEFEIAKSAYFITLTYSDENVPKGNILRKSDLQAYIKRLRNYSSLRYFAVGEYGEQYKRPHYHVLLFNLDYNQKEQIEKCWGLGHVSIGSVTAASIHYCTKDMMKDVEIKSVNGVQSFRIMSTRPAIGKEYLKNLMNQKLNDDFSVRLNGMKTNMPRYYRDKVFNYAQKEKHALEMIQEADKRFQRMEDKAKLAGENVHLYIQKEQESLERVNKKLLKLRKL